MERTAAFFDVSDVALATRFADKVNLWGEHTATITSCESENDQLEMGCWTITKVESTRVVHSVSGDTIVPCIDYVCESEVTRMSNNRMEPDDSDTVEFARTNDLWSALKACALAEFEWSLDQMDMSTETMELES